MNSLTVSLLTRYGSASGVAFRFSSPRYAGATMAVYSCMGFGGGFVGSVLFGFTLDAFGGASHLPAWVASFGTSSIACLIGAAVTALLSRDVERRA